MNQKEKMAEMKERNYHDVVARIKENKFAHCSTLMVTEQRMNDLKRHYLYAAVPSGCAGKCFMFCKV